jgi:hypothetical protein
VDAPLRSPFDSTDLVAGDLVAEAQKRALASAATERHFIGPDKADPLQAGLAPKLDDKRSADEQHPPHAASHDDPRPPQPPDDEHERTVVAHGIDQTGGDILRVESSFLAPNRDSITKRKNPVSYNNLSTGAFGLSDKALARLEAALRAQRENQILAPPAQLTAAPEISDNAGARQEADTVALPPTLARFGFCARNTTYQLPRAVRLQSVPGYSLADNEGRVQTPDTFNSQPPPRAPEHLRSSEPPPPVENDVEQHISQLTASSEREGTHRRLPRAVPLPPVTGLPPVEENAEKVPRAGETFINSLRVPPSFVAERPRPPRPMQPHRNKIIAPLLVIACAGAVLVAYYFSVGSSILKSESGRGQKASLGSRIVASPITVVASQQFRPNESHDSTAAAPPENAISSQGAIIPPMKTSHTVELSLGTALSQSPASPSATSFPGATSSQGAASPEGETTAMLSPSPSGTRTPPASTAVRTLDPEDIKLLMKKGEQFIAAGDLATARLVFRRASEAGDATATLAMGATYDPIVLAKLGVLGMSADAGKARSWYEKAEELGSSEASRRLELLANR